MSYIISNKQLVKLLSGYRIISGGTRAEALNNLIACWW